MTIDAQVGGQQGLGRGGKGRELMQRGGFTRVVPNAVEVPLLETQS